MRLIPALERLLAPISIAVFALVLGAVLASAGRTLGFDFLAYHSAAVRVLDGQPAYDTTFFGAGGFGLFYYPPTFIPLVLPFGLLGATTATWLWIGLSIAAFAIGVVVLPVSGRTQWLLVLLAGVSWPFLYAVKLGQVGPILFALFAAGWAGMSTPSVLGTSGGLGAAIKIQPALILLWALLTRRTRAFVIGLGVLAVLAVVATILAGTEAWSDFFTLMGRVSDPITTAHNFTPGAVAYQAGVSRETASLIQWVSMGLVADRLRRGSAVATGRAVVPDRGRGQPAALADPVGPLRADPAAAVAWLIERGWTWAAAHPARDLHPADRVRPRPCLPDRLRRHALCAARRGLPGPGPRRAAIAEAAPRRDRYLATARAGRRPTPSPVESMDRVRSPVVWAGSCSRSLRSSCTGCRTAPSTPAAATCSISPTPSCTGGCGSTSSRAPSTSSSSTTTSTSRSPRSPRSS